MIGIKLLVDNPNLFLKAIDLASNDFGYLNLRDETFKETFKAKVKDVYKVLKELKNEVEP